jgi:hypothetical protein
MSPDLIGFTRSHILLLTGHPMMVLASDWMSWGTGLLSFVRQVICTGRLQ